MIFRLEWHCSHVCVQTHSHTDQLRHTVEYVQGIVSSQNVCICFFLSRLVVQCVAMASLFVGRPCCRRTILILGILSSLWTSFIHFMCVCELCCEKRACNFTSVYEIYLHPFAPKRIQSDFCHFNVIIFTVCYRENGASAATSAERKKKNSTKTGVWVTNTSTVHRRWKESMRCKNTLFFYIVQLLLSWEYFELVVLLYISSDAARFGVFYMFIVHIN